jgi:hypothetical protein
MKQTANTADFFQNKAWLSMDFTALYPKGHNASEDLANKDRKFG